MIPTPPPVIVTQHALERYVERVDHRLTFAQAEAKIRESERAIQIAAGFGCHRIRLGCGAKLLLVETRVVTVIARGQHSRDELPGLPPAPSPEMEA